MKAVKNICKKMGVDGCQKNPLLTKQITGAILENSFIVPQNVLNIQLSCDAKIPILGIYIPKK